MSETNYNAIVVKIDNLRKIEKADRLLATNIFGNNVIVGINTKEGDIGLYFPLESQIGEEFATKNDLIRRKNEDGTYSGGMFADNRRVKAQIFRGERSMGFFIPIESLGKLGEGFDLRWEDLKVGTEIDKFNGFEISKKYIPKFSRTPGEPGQSKGKKVKVSKIVPGQFRFHADTAQLGKNVHKVMPDDDITITFKYHGTSAIAGNLRTYRKLKWWEKALKFIGIKPKSPFKYEMIYASRSVIKNDDMNKSHNHYYGEDLWSDVGKYHFAGKLKEGETIYYEIVGYTSSGKPIQAGYPYGCHSEKGDNQYKIFVYRITKTNQYGEVVEYPWKSLVKVCEEYGVQPALTLYQGRAADKYPDIDPDLEIYRGYDWDWNKEFLARLQEEYLEKDCPFNKKGTPAEGICLRIEPKNSYSSETDLQTFKLKSFRFLKHETEQLDKEIVDIETEQGEQ